MHCLIHTFFFRFCLYVYVQQGKDGPTLDDEGNKIINVTSKGQALTLLRQRNKIKRDFNKMQNEKQEKVEEMRERNFILNKEMPMRVVLTEQNVSAFLLLFLFIFPEFVYDNNCDDAKIGYNSGYTWFSAEQIVDITSNRSGKTRKEVEERGVCFETRCHV